MALLQSPKQNDHRSEKSRIHGARHSCTTYLHSGYYLDYCCTVSSHRMSLPPDTHSLWLRARHIYIVAYRRSGNDIADSGSPTKRLTLLIFLGRANVFHYSLLRLLLRYICIYNARIDAMILFTRKPRSCASALGQCCQSRPRLSLSPRRSSTTSLHNLITVSHIRHTHLLATQTSIHSWRRRSRRSNKTLLTQSSTTT